MSPRINISAGELFELIRPAVFFLSAILSTWVFFSARRHFSLLVSLLWALATLFLPPVVLPLYLIILIQRRGKPTLKPFWKHALPLIYAGITIGSIALYLYRQNRGVDFHLARAAHAKIRGNHAKAIAEYQAALREEDDAHTHKLLARELSDAGYWTEALAEFRLAERGGEPDELMFFSMGRLLDAIKLPSQAKLEYQRFLESSLCLQELPDRRCEAARSKVSEAAR